MFLRSTLRALASVTLLTAFALTGAAPASAVEAAALAESERLNTLSCGNSGAARLFSVDERSGDLSQVGVPSPSQGDSEKPFYSCGWQGAFDPATGLSYYPLLESTSSVPEGRWTLRSVDTATGVSSQVAEFADDTVPLGLVIDGDGQAYSLTGRSIEGSFVMTFDSIDLRTGELRRISQLDLGPTTSATLTIDRATGVLYAVTSHGLVGTIDPATGSITRLGGIRLDDDQVIPAAALSSDGSLWFLRRIKDVTPEAVQLGRVRLADLQADAGAEIDPTYVGTLTSGGAPFDSRSLWISTTAAPVEPSVVVPTAAPQLAETGVDTQNVLFGGFAAGSLLLLGAGTLMAVGAVRRTQV